MVIIWELFIEISIENYFDFLLEMVKIKYRFRRINNLVAQLVGKDYKWKGFRQTDDALIYRDPSEKLRIRPL